MHLRYVILLFVIAAASYSTDAAGFDISFYETPPAFPTGTRLSVASGVNPGTPVLFDLSRPDRVVLRPAAKGETPTETRPFFKFEWQEDKSARFYRLTPPKLLAELSAKNAADTADADGKNFEQKVVQQFFRQGDVLRTCLPQNKPFRGTLTVFIVVGTNGKLDSAIVQPEGSIAECILDQTKETIFTSPSAARTFTAKADIHVTP